MMRFQLFAVSLCLILSSGCIQINLPDRKIRNTATYELSPQAPVAAFPVPVEVLPFVSDSPTKFKMLYRKGNSLRENEYGKWAQTPPRMLTRFFRESFPVSSGKELLILRGKILTFEADEDSKKVNLSISYNISKEGESEPFLNFIQRSSVPMKAVSDDEYAEAMRQAIADQVREVKRKIQKKLSPGK